MKNSQKLTILICTIAIIITSTIISCSTTKDIIESNDKQKTTSRNFIKPSAYSIPTFNFHIIGNEEIEENFYKTRIPKAYSDAFLYYTRNHKELRMSFYSIMVHESANFKVYERKNSNGSYDLGPSHLNTNNIKNAYFRELYNPTDESHITNKYCFYMVMSLNYFIDMVDKFDGNLTDAYYAYNGGQKAPSIIHSKNIPKNKQKFAKNVSAYGNAIINNTEKYAEELKLYKQEILNYICKGLEYLRNHEFRYESGTNVYIQFNEIGQLVLKTTPPISNVLVMNNSKHFYKFRNDIIVNNRRDDYIPNFAEDEYIIG